MSAVKETYHGMLRDAVAPALHAMGFKGGGRLYLLDDERSWARLEFQARYQSADELCFTINLVVVNKDAWRGVRRDWPHYPDVPSPNIYDVPSPPFLWQTRIGHVMPGGRDVWWPLFAEDDLTVVVNDVLTAIRDYAVPGLLEQRSRVSSA